MLLEFIHIIKKYKKKERCIPQNREYIIIPIGTYCLPRIITTIGKLKPRKKEGELTCPFDLAFFNNIDQISFLIKTKFQGFFENLEYNDENKYYVNRKLNCIFNHDGELTKEEFIKRYTHRIENFYTYAKNNKYNIFIFATVEKYSLKQIQTLYGVLKTLRGVNPFSLIVLNDNSENIDFCIDNIYTINVFDFEKINQKGLWATEIMNQTKNGKEFSDKLLQKIRNIITQKLNLNIIRN